MHDKLVSLSLVLLTALASAIQAEPENAMPTPSYPPVSIKNSHSIELKSSINDTLYSIYVLLPDGYHEKTDTTYPVLYTVDAQWDFSLLTGMLGGLAGAHLIPPMILVGITVPEVGDYAFRERDYVSTEGSAEFLSFLSQDLVPFIEKTYRADSTDRLLIGTSYGGSFVFYTLFHQPDLFHRYLAGSSSLWAGDEMAFSYEERFAKNNTSLDAKLFMAVGEYENPNMVGTHNRMVEIFEKRQYKGFELSHMTVAEELHNSIKPEAYSRGLRALYAQKHIAVHADILERYVGRYRIDFEGEEFILTVTRQGARLYSQSKYDDHPVALNADSETRFWNLRIPVDLIFHPDEDGQVRSMSMFDYVDGYAKMLKIED